MDSFKEKSRVNLNLSNEEALVLFDWLARFNESRQISFQDQSEERILYDLESILEKSIAELFEGNYKNKLLKAREKIRDQNGL